MKLSLGKRLFYIILTLLILFVLGYLYYTGVSLNEAV